MQRIGLYGGSFDPVHIGHVLVGQAASEELSLDRLFFIPAARSPFKPDQQPAPSEMRMALLRLALAGRPKWELDDFEVQRGGTSFTIDTVRYFSKRFPAARLFYLVGADNIAGLPKWREAETLASLATFVVIPRPGDAATELPAPFQGIKLKGFPFAVSSSEIRARVRASLPIDALVSPPVAEAIRNNQLYL